MNKFFKIIYCGICIVFIINIFFTINVNAENNEKGNYKGKFSYVIINKEIYVTDINKNIKELTIPSTIDGYSVRYISSRACYDGQLNQLILPNTINEIGSEAFKGCSFKEIDIPSNVTSVGDRAFYVGYYGMNNQPSQINLNDGILYIGNEAFANLFWNINSIVIPESTRYIGKGAFYDQKLENVYIMGMETEFDDRVFYYKSLYGGTYVESAIIYAYEGSKAFEYAKEFGYTFKSLGKFTGVQKSGNRVCGYENSKKISGLKQIDGNLYYFSKTRGNYAQTGLIEMDNGNIYYFSKKAKNYGQALTGWVKIGDKKYYFLSSGDNKYKAAKGWMKIKDEKYYFYSDGTMATGKVTIKEKNYEFDKNGKLIS
ncbi:MAG: leucine-rich repeat protein [Eubacterium sp.]|nr:leucine-rich repeat protein [Eubacterium sp.]